MSRMICSGGLLQFHYIVIARLYLSDHAAGNFISRVARRLCSEVIRSAVDNDSPANDILAAETVCHHCQAGRPIAGEQGRKIPGVQRVIPVIWIIMAAGIGKTDPGTVRQNHSFFIQTQAWGVVKKLDIRLQKV